jgi:hypothetical protein
MKSKLCFSKWLMMLILPAISLGAWAQSTTDPDHACLNSTQDYWVINTSGSTYNWVLSGGGTITTGQGTDHITVNWTATGPQTLTITETITSTGCIGTPVILNIIVDPLPLPTITGPVAACVTSTTSTYTTEAGMTAYLWSVSAGGAITAGAGTNAITVTWNTAGAQTVSVNYNNANLCTASTATVYNVTVNPLPVPTITGPVAACVTSTTSTYTTEAGMTAYLWSISAGGAITAGAGTNAITVTWNTAGAQSVSVNYNNANLCTAPAATVYNVTVNPLPVVTLTGASPVCVNSTSEVYTTEAGMSGYVWAVSAGGTISSGGTATDNTVTVTWVTSGAQTVSVNYNNANGCKATTPTVENVTVNPLPVTSPIWHN